MKGKGCNAVFFMLLLLAGTSAAMEMTGWGVSGWMENEIETAHISMGRIKNTHPCWNVDLGMRGNLDCFGYLLAGIWTESDLDGNMREAHKWYFHELDPMVGYGYHWDVVKDIALESRVGAQWNYMAGYDGPDRRSYDEWQLREELKMPWITPWFGMRNFYCPVMKASFRLGVKRSFAITERLSFDPNIWSDGGSARWNRQRFGYSGCDVGDIPSGFNSLMVRMFFSYRLCDHVKLFGGVTEYVVLDPEIRHNLRSNPAENSMRDIAVFTVGVRCEL